MQNQICCGYCRKFSDIKSVIRFYPYDFIHIDYHRCLFKHLQKLDQKKVESCLNGLTDSMRYAMAKKL